MAINIHIPPPLREQTNGLSVIEGSGTTVKQVIDQLASQFPLLADRIMQDGKLHRFLNVLVNDEDIRSLDMLDTAVKDGDTVAISPLIGGG